MPPTGPTTAELAVEVAAAPGEVTEPDRVDVHRVQRDQGVDQGLGGPAAGGARREQALGVAGGVQGHAVDVAHHEERRAVDPVVLDRGHASAARGRRCPTAPT